MRRGRPAATRGTTRKAAPAKQGTRKATPTNTRKTTNAKTSNKRDVTEYASKPPTDYHKAFARWIMQEVGYDPEAAKSSTRAFLMGVAIATAARPAFQSSDYLEEWREKTGQAKRGPKPKSTAETKRRSTRQVVSDDEFEDDSDEFEDDENELDDEFDDESDEDTEEFEDNDSDDDFDDEDDETDSEEDDDEFEDEEEEAPEPPKRGRGRPAKGTGSRATSNARGTRGVAAKKRTNKTTSDDDDILF